MYVRLWYAKPSNYVISSFGQNYHKTLKFWGFFFVRQHLVEGMFSLDFRMGLQNVYRGKFTVIFSNIFSFSKKCFGIVQLNCRMFQNMKLADSLTHWTRHPRNS